MVSGYVKVWSGKVGDVEEYIFESDICVDDVVLSKSEDSLVVKSGYYAHVPELGFNVHDGMFYCRDDDGEYMSDFAIAVICDEAADGPEDCLYWEQDGFVVSLANYLHGQGRSIREISELACDLYVPEDAAA